jgi:hypothetical protein
MVARHLYPALGLAFLSAPIGHNNCLGGDSEIEKPLTTAFMELFIEHSAFAIDSTDENL